MSNATGAYDPSVRYADTSPTPLGRKSYAFFFFHSS